MRHRRALAVTLLGALTLVAVTLTAPAAAAARQAATPTPLPPIDSLITEGVAVEGPLINGVTLPVLR
ncbi:hypothetical protein ACOBQB_07700 [Streptomyces sp. G5(2025)]|uniref:hypothetical protein n=1 Tax=Streptomyces sp. G5(2025) TaxID=3406628 RepID=UPI003C1D304E